MVLIYIKSASSHGELARMFGAFQGLSLARRKKGVSAVLRCARVVARDVLDRLKSGVVSPRARTELGSNDYTCSRRGMSSRAPGIYLLQQWGFGERMVAVVKPVCRGGIQLTWRRSVQNETEAETSSHSNFERAPGYYSRGLLLAPCPPPPVRAAHYWRGRQAACDKNR